MRALLKVPILAFLLSISLTLYTVTQSEFWELLFFTSLAFAGYIYFLFNKQDAYSFQELLGLAIVCRMIAIPAFPLLSDDIYRFYWDAWVYMQGESPYAMLPSEVIHLFPDSGMREIYNKLNSPDYYSVYPPFLQWIFRTAFWFSPQIEGFSIAYKSLVFLSELLSLTFLYLCVKKLDLKESHLLIYALNPLIILELGGNGHPEAFMITGLVMVIYGLIQIPWLSSLGWALGIGIKLQPLLLAPLLLAYSLRKNKVIWWLGSFLLAGLLLLPLMLNFQYLQNFTESLSLYTQTFEFNGSLYKIVRWLGYEWVGYNMIRTTGPLLSLIAFLSILLLSVYYFTKNKPGLVSLLKFMTLCWLIYLFCSPIVHPWYITPLILFSVITPFISMILWSFLIMFSYIAYSGQTVYEPYWLGFMQYIPVFILLYFDLRKGWMNKLKLR